MSLTPEAIERRRAVVGASEVGLLFGLPAYGNRTISDIWYEKKYGTLPSKGNASTDLGNKLEPVILEQAEERLGCKIVDRQKWVTLGSNGATLDGREIGEGALVEAKTSGIIGPSKTILWGPDDSDEVPEQYLAQVQAQLLVTGAEMAYLAALIGGRGFAMFRIYPHAELMRAIADKSAVFIASLEGDAPPAEPPQLETLKRLRRQPDKVLPQSDEFDDLYQQLEAAKAVAKDGEQAKELIQRKLLAMLGDAEAAETRNGLVTYYQRSRKESFVAASTYRQLGFQKGK